MEIKKRFLVSVALIGVALMAATAGAGYNVTEINPSTGGNAGRMTGLGDGTVLVEYDPNTVTSAMYHMKPDGTVTDTNDGGNYGGALQMVSGGEGYAYLDFVGPGNWVPGNNLYRFESSTGTWADLGTEGGGDPVIGLGDGTLLTRIDVNMYHIALDGTVTVTPDSGGGTMGTVHYLESAGNGTAYGHYEPPGTYGGKLYVFDRENLNWPWITDAAGGALGGGLRMIGLGDGSVLAEIDVNIVHVEPDGTVAGVSAAGGLSDWGSPTTLIGAGNGTAWFVHDTTEYLYSYSKKFGLDMINPALPDRVTPMEDGSVLVEYGTAMYHMTPNDLDVLITDAGGGSMGGFHGGPDDPISTIEPAGDGAAYISFNIPQGKMYVLQLEGTCGDYSTEYLPADIDEDCYVSLGDLAEMAVDWLQCTNPNDSACD